MDASLLEHYRARPAKPVFIRSTPKARVRSGLLVTAICAGLAVASVAALIVTAIPYFT